MLIPDYLTINQSEFPQADHQFITPSLTLSLKNFLWKPLGSSGLLNTSYLDSFLGALQ